MLSKALWIWSSTSLEEEGAGILSICTIVTFLYLYSHLLLWYLPKSSTPQHWRSVIRTVEGKCQRDTINLILECITASDLCKNSDRWLVYSAPFNIILFDRYLDHLWYRFLICLSSWRGNIIPAFLIFGLFFIFFLWRSRTGFERTETMINRLIMWSISTGLLTSLAAILALIFVSNDMIWSKDGFWF